MTENGLLEGIDAKLESIAQVQQGIPKQIENMRGDMEGIAEKVANKAIARHKADCAAALNFGAVADRAAENTGVLKTLRDTGTLRRSLAPAARVAVNLPPWAKVLIPAILTAILGALGYSAQ